jgi:hypothetical protein
LSFKGSSEGAVLYIKEANTRSIWDTLERIAGGFTAYLDYFK